jgi:DNA-3-methyladenine glycosylase
VARTLSRGWFARSAPEVAPDLLGRILARTMPDGSIVRARIVETEAYEPDDPASHAARGRTERNAAMFGPPGHLYVYFVYGMHHCMNVVTGPVGRGSAVLLRAAEPLEGLETMRVRRGTADRDLCRGPARLAQAFGVDRGFDGVDVLGHGPLRIEAGRAIPKTLIRSTVRIGVSAGTETRWRFVVRASAWASREPRQP